jgi:hypothetical protein
MDNAKQPNHCNILFTENIPEMRGLWDGAAWRRAELLDVNCIRPESSDHCPWTQCKLLYDEQSLYGIFRVEDRYVRCVHTSFQSDVWKDSCVEFFVQPKGAGGYFNFEFNCGGALLASYVTNPARVNGRLQEFVPLTPDDDGQIRRFASLPSVVEPEISQPLVWCLEFSLPFALLAKYAGPFGAVTGQIWRANFYKCGNETSHSHWLSWMPLPGRNFHDPSSFGQLVFNAL